MKTLNELLANGTADEIDAFIVEEQKRHKELVKELRVLSKIRRSREAGIETDPDEKDED